LLIELEDADDVAHLHALEAMTRLAQLNYDRDVSLLRSQSVSQQTADTDLATLQNDQAQAEQQRALIGYKSIRAPYAGRLGIRQVDIGQYIAPGTPIVTLQQLDPIFVDFYLPQQDVAKIKVGQSVTANVDTYPDVRWPDHQPSCQRGEPKCAGPRQLQESRREIAAGNVCDGPYRCRNTDGPCDAAKDSDLLQFIWRHRLSG
jgi:multidrug efflux pump subunit AcrA (membrane-fusion protein)